MEDLEARLKAAQELFQRAYHAQMEGELEGAIRLYQASIESYPTAEAYTFLGWTYSFQGRYQEAIEECQKAIAVDPEFGNPWNDIGAYLIELGKLDEAVPYLVQATEARRYDSYCFPHFNLGRVWLMKGRLDLAMASFEKALAVNPGYTPAAEALAQLRLKMN